MSDQSHDLDDPPHRRGIVAQTATTLLIGVPMTIGLVVATAVYFIFEYTKFKFFSKSERTRPPRPDALNTVTVSIAIAESHDSAIPVEKLPPPTKSAGSVKG